MKELSLNILDIVQNSIRAKAKKISVEIKESAGNDLYEIIIKDNGTGIPPEILENVTNPFITTRTRRRMGLGLSLLRYHAELTGGRLAIFSNTDAGTEVKADFSYKHIDRQPLGDIVGVLIILMAGNQEIDFIYHHTTEKGNYRFSSRETKEFLETNTLNDGNLLKQIGRMIGENLKEIEASGFDLSESYRADI